IPDDFKWNVVSELVERKSKNSQKLLLQILRSGNESDKIKAAEYLIRFEDLKGLKFYVEWIKDHKIYPSARFEKSPLLYLRKLNSVPLLIELLEITYQEDFKQDDFHRLDNIVLDTLTIIAIQSDKHYAEINKSIMNFIITYSEKNEKVNFLHMFLEKLEQRFYASKSQKLDINDVIKKLKKIQF
ncbi:MAG: hypothetical protein AMJ90_10045, partial [candidate division Zixibacteria bacterium SM23_73_2]